MTGKLEGKVAVVTGAGRGQGRSHAVRFAEEGADIIAIDVCSQFDTVAYPMTTIADLEETEALVRKAGREVVTAQADVRDFQQIADAVDEAVGSLGRLDFVLANAGIMPILGSQSQDFAAFHDAIAVMLTGVYHTIEAAVPALLAHEQGGAIVITSSGAGLKVGGVRMTTMSHGAAGYVAAKHGVVGLMRYYANALAERNIRVNTVHPTGVSTPMVVNQQFEDYASEHPEFGATMQNLLPTHLVDASDVTEAMVYLCADSGRFVTGVTLPVDAGFTAK